MSKTPSLLGVLIYLDCHFAFRHEGTSYYQFIGVCLIVFVLKNVIPIFTIFSNVY